MEFPSSADFLRSSRLFAMSFLTPVPSERRSPRSYIAVGSPSDTASLKSSAACM